MVRNFVSLFLLPATLMMAGKFNCGRLNTSSELVTLRIPHPPDAYPQVKSIKVQIVEGDKAFTDQPRLKAQIEQALAKDFNVDAPKADAVLRVTVVAYDAPTVNYVVQTESRSVAVGNTVQTQQVPVKYWIGSGKLSLRVQMVDTDGAPLDTFNPEEVYSVRREDIVEATGPGTAPKHDFLKLPPLPGTRKTAKPVETAATGKEMTVNEIKATMLDTVSQKILRRYVRSFDTAEFKLACDDELRAGNRFAMGTAPDWEKATQSWTAANVGKNEADRSYNLAVAQEALAYKAYDATLNPADALPFFEKALSLYEKAQQLDPSEKYISASTERLNVARTDIGRAVEQRKLWEAERDRARAAFVEQQQGKKAIEIKREDSPKESAYRQLVRASLSSDPKRNPDSMRDMGEKLGLNELEVQRVLTQESTRMQGLVQYETMLTQMTADGVLSKEERQALNAYYPTLDMTEADARAVEKKHQFREEGVAPPRPAAAPSSPGPSPAPPAGPARKSAAPAPAPSQKP